MTGLDSGSSLDAIYLDSSKAFDFVKHEHPKVKLRVLRVQVEGLAWIDDFLTDRCQRVCVNTQLSDWACVRSGVPQGSVLVPSLFVVIINDMPESVSGLCSMYADYTKVDGEADCEIYIKKLRSDLDSLVVWADTWPTNVKCSI